MDNDLPTLYNNNFKILTEKIPHNCKTEPLIIKEIFEKMNEGVVITNEKAEIIYVNNAFQRVTKYKKSEVVGKNPNILQSGLHDYLFYKEMWQSLMKSGSWEGEIWNQRKSGEIYPEWLEIFTVKNDKKQQTYFVALFSDITNKKQVEDQIEELSFIDQLTGVSNRSALKVWLTGLLNESEKENKQFTVLYLDLDRFQLINDSLGHSYGDELLKKFSSRIKNLAQKSDFIARLGGDEFVIVMPRTYLKSDVKRFCEKILYSLKEPFIIYGEEIFITCTIGVSFFPENGKNVDLLLRNADKAMYCAKLGGRNSFRFYESTMHKDEDKRLQMENHLRKALEKNELFLQYQPIVNLKTKSVTAVEALLRWEQESLGFISPGQFIPLAEESGLIIPISEWVIEQSCRQLNELHEQGYPYLKMCINISAVHFNQEDFVEKIENILKKINVKRQHIILELTESMIMSRSDHVINKLVRLKQLGIQLAIDDFGTGYSSLSYLHRFPIDILKIDQSFIKHLHTYKENAAIVQTIIMLAKILNLSIIAEGVESKRQYDFLLKENCTNIQGFYITKALSVRDLKQFLNMWDSGLL